MRTEAQINASRINGAKSRGPVSAAGKLHSSRNSYQHGLLASTFVLDIESQDRFRALYDSLFARFEPEGPFEESLVEIMIAARWRQLRIGGFETAGLQDHMRRQIEAAPALANENPATRGAIGFRGLSDDSRSLDLINRYDTRYERQYFRAHRRLLDVQNLRKLPPAAGSLPEPRETVLLNEPGNSLKTQIHTPPNPPGTQAAPNPSQDFP